MSKQPPIPQGNYVTAARSGGLVYTSGMTPRRGGVLILSGNVSMETPLENYREAVRLAAENALTAACQTLQAGEKIEKVLSITVYVAAAEGFTLHSRIADFASAYLQEKLGDAGIGSRVAVGVASLPGNAPVEIQLVVAAG